MCFPHLGVFLISVKPLTTENTEIKTTPKICKITVTENAINHVRHPRGFDLWSLRQMKRGSPRISAGMLLTFDGAERLTVTACSGVNFLLFQGPLQVYSFSLFRTVLSGVSVCVRHTD